jgi:transketolase
MGIAPVVYTLWQRFLRFDPADPIWPNRDRFVLSEGHASALLWSLLHLAGVRAVDPDYEVLGRASVTLADLKTFRQLDLRCPGHPEYRWTSGVETTTGPLGQDVATSVGMAVAGRWLAARYNRDGFALFDFDVYAVAGDGDMMEGISSEAASLAGHQRLSNLCWIYDSNRTSVEGHTDITFTEDVAERFLAYGWNVTTVSDANDLDAVQRALHSFRAEHARPTLVVVHSHIGYGSPVEDTAKAHGEPLGPQVVREPTARGIRSRPTRSSGSSAGSSRTAGRTRCPRFPPMRRASLPVTPRVRCSTRSHRRCHGCWAARPTSPRPPRPA